MKKGVTLIELIVLMVFVNILATITVPNFQEVKTRSDVARVKADLRILAAAIEAYQLEWNVPPPEAGRGPFPFLVIDGYSGQSAILTPALTTPIAYTTNFLLRDPFLYHYTVPLYVYECYNWMWWNYSDSILFPFGDRLDGYQFKYYYNRWRLFSLGPDREYDNIPGGSPYSTPSPVGMPYDPTNGTISSGNIIRSEKYPEQKTRKGIYW